MQFRRIGTRDIVVELLQIRIVLLADPSSTAAEMQHRWRGNSYLGRLPGVSCEKLKVRELDVFCMLDLADHTHDRRRKLLHSIRLLDGDRNVCLHAGELLKKVDVKIG